MRTNLMGVILGVLALSGISGRAQINDPERLRNALEKQREINAELEERIRGYRETIAEEQVNLEKLEDLEKKLSQTEDRFLEIQRDLFEKEDEFAVLETLALTYWDRFKPNYGGISPGYRIPSIKSSLGEQYSDVEIVGVVDGGVEIRHAGGSAKLAFQDLPREVLDQCTLRPMTSGPYILTSEEIQSRRPRDLLLRGPYANELLRRERIRSEVEYVERQQRAKRELQRRQEETARLNRERAERKVAMERELEAKYREREEHNAAIDVKIAGLQTRIATLKSERGVLRSRRYEEEKSFRNAAIKPDRKVHTEKLAGFDAAIAKVDAALAQLTEQIRILETQKK